MIGQLYRRDHGRLFSLDKVTTQGAITGNNEETVMPRELQEDSFVAQKYA